MYSRTSDNGPSEERTTSIKWTDRMARIELAICLVYNEPSSSV